MEIKVLNKQGSETGRTVTLSESIFGLSPNDHAIYLDVKQFMANQRQGTHKTKERKEIHRSTKRFSVRKVQGSTSRFIESRYFCRGARIHGPRPRDYSFKLNKKLKRLARLSALSYKAKTNNIMIVEDFDMSTPKTSEFANMLKALKVTGRTLFVTSEIQKNIVLSGRNIEGNTVMRASDMNTYAVMKAGQLILTESSIAKIQEANTK